MKLSGIDNRGHFFSLIENLLQPPLHGEGYWNELGKQVTFSMFADLIDFGGNKINFSFNGYQIEGVRTDDPASDKVWTLAGSYQVSLIGESLEHLPDQIRAFGVQDSRRQAIGWYAQITEIM